MDSIFILRVTFVSIFLAVFSIKLLLDFLNIRFMRKHSGTIPAGFEAEVDSDRLKEMQEYTSEQTRLGLVKFLCEIALLFSILFGGPLHFFISTAYKFSHPVTQGLVFFLMLGGVYWFFFIPFDLLKNFRLEQRFGFNRQTFSLWVIDLTKSTFLTILLGGMVLIAVLSLIYKTGPFWWLYSWGTVFVFGIIFTILYPVLIAPIFNKFFPVENSSLREKIEQVVKECGIHPTGIFKMDAGRRSTHSNAYFTGLGRNKRIVLFDTLVEKLDENAITTVVAHEAGHWKRKHLLKGFIISEVYSFLWFLIAGLLLRSPTFHRIFFINSQPFWAGLLLLGIIWIPVNFLLSPFFAAYSRKNECEADDMVIELTDDSESFKRALVTLSKDNLANLNPHPLYVRFYYSHLPPPQRVDRILSIEKSQR